MSGPPSGPMWTAAPPPGPPRPVNKAQRGSKNQSPPTAGVVVLVARRHRHLVAGQARRLVAIVTGESKSRPQPGNNRGSRKPQEGDSHRTTKPPTKNPQSFDSKLMESVAAPPATTRAWPRQPHPPSTGRLGDGRLRPGLHPRRSGQRAVFAVCRSGHPRPAHFDGADQARKLGAIPSAREAASTLRRRGITPKHPPRSRVVSLAALITTAPRPRVVQERGSAGSPTPRDPTWMTCTTGGLKYG